MCISLERWGTFDAAVRIEINSLFGCVLQEVSMKPINMAILGCGAIAKRMAAAIPLCPEVTAYAAAARDAQRAEQFARDYGFAKAYGSYEALLADPAVELVYIAVPHALHSACALMCLRAGKNIVVEKPFTANYAQAKEVIDLAREKHLMAAEGIWMRYLPNLSNIVKACRQGMIGNVKMLTGEIGYHLTQERLFDPAMAGGALLDVGVYAVSLAGLLFGYDVEKVASCAVLTDRGVDETNSFVLQYSGGRQCSMSTSMAQMSSCRGTIWGDAGFMDISNVNSMGVVTVYDGDQNQITCFANPKVDNSYVYELRSLVKALREGRLDTPESPHEEILKRTALMDTIRGQWGMTYPFE